MSARVVHVVVAGEIGGAERMLVDLASRPESSRATHTVALMTPSEALRAFFARSRMAIVDRGAVRENAAAFLWRSLGPADVAWLTRVMRDANANIAHLHTFGSQVIGTRAAARVGARVVRTEHSTRVYDDPSCWPFSRWSLARTDAAVAISAHVRDRALAKAPDIAPRMHVIANGVDLDRFGARRFPAFGERLPLVAVGRLEPRKGFDVLLEAVAKVPAIDLAIVGDGESRAALEATAAKLALGDRVRFHGYVADPRDIVAASAAAVCSSREEGLGIALLEAMALGRPVLALPVGGVPEFVIDGDTGMLARGRSAGDLAELLARAARESASLPALGARASDFVRARYAVQAMCSAYGDVYASVIAAPPRASRQQRRG